MLWTRRSAPSSTTARAASSRRGELAHHFAGLLGRVDFDDGRIAQIASFDASARPQS